MRGRNVYVTCKSEIPEKTKMKVSRDTGGFETTRISLNASAVGVFTIVPSRSNERTRRRKSSGCDLPA